MLPLKHSSVGIANLLMTNYDFCLELKHVPPLDRNFLPAALWNRAYEANVAIDVNATSLTIALERSANDISVLTTKVLSRSPENDWRTLRYLERILKFLLWQKGASRVYVAGRPDIARNLESIYSPTGERRFDALFMGDKVYGKTFELVNCYTYELPKSSENQALHGRHWKGCRIGFDLGGSTRKCVALIDGEVVFSEEVPWNPYFQNSSEYHLKGIRSSLSRAAEHLPRVDAIGGSAAGIYVNNEVRVSSLFRGIAQTEFEQVIRPMFHRIQQEWNGIPFEVINDGEVTALAGAFHLKEHSVLGISMGTSQAAGFINNEGKITTWLNELAFAPVDYAAHAPVDEWSSDIGCGVQYFSQQAVGRLIAKAGIALPDQMPLSEKMISVQRLVESKDPRARLIYLTIGTYLGYTLAHYRYFYHFKSLLLLGQVTIGAGGDVMQNQARKVLVDEFPDISDSIRFVSPDDKQRKYGQAIAAASLPVSYHPN